MSEPHDWMADDLEETADRSVEKEFPFQPDWEELSRIELEAQALAKEGKLTKSLINGLMLRARDALPDPARKQYVLDDMLADLNKLL